MSFNGLIWCHGLLCGGFAVVLVFVIGLFFKDSKEE